MRPSFVQVLRPNFNYKFFRNCLYGSFNICKCFLKQVFDSKFAHFQKADKLCRVEDVRTYYVHTRAHFMNSQILSRKVIADVIPCVQVSHVCFTCHVSSHCTRSFGAVQSILHDTSTCKDSFYVSPPQWEKYQKMNFSSRDYQEFQAGVYIGTYEYKTNIRI